MRFIKKKESFLSCRKVLHRPWLQYALAFASYGPVDFVRVRGEGGGAGVAGWLFYRSKQASSSLLLPAHAHVQLTNAHCTPGLPDCCTIYYYNYHCSRHCWLARLIFFILSGYATISMTKLRIYFLACLAAPRTTLALVFIFLFFVHLL